MSKRYVITGINRLTREREDISRPFDAAKAEKIFDEERRKPSRRRTFIYLKLREYPYREESLKCSGGGKSVHSSVVFIR